MTTDDYLRAVDLRPVAGSRPPAGRDVEQSELTAPVAQWWADESPAGVRDGAVIGLAYLSGARRGRARRECSSSGSGLSRLTVRYARVRRLIRVFAMTG